MLASMASVRVPRWHTVRAISSYPSALREEPGRGELSSNPAATERALQPTNTGREERPPEQPITRSRSFANHGREGRPGDI